MNLLYTILLVLLFFYPSSTAQGNPNLIPLEKAWSKNSINANILRRNSVVSHEGTQYVAYYDKGGHVMLAKRHLKSEQWDIQKTQYKGDIYDAHNSISIMVDGEGYLHMSWDHHNHPLRYSRSVAPGSLELTSKMAMTGKNEDRVTYPEFYRLANGNLIFAYRSGKSGAGNLILNHYDTQTQEWTQLHENLISGEGERNAYWQMCVDPRGNIHLSWVWRESPNVATNHDMAYAKSTDGGLTWQKSNAEVYELPITQATAEYAAYIPQAHELINTTSMTTDTEGNPYIASYWRPEGELVPQYHLVYHDGAQWQTRQISKRTTPFTLSGGGTKRIPISRCQILADSRGETTRAYLLFRDIERGNRVSVAINEDIRKNDWYFKDLTQFSVDMWEPSYDTELWNRKKQMHVYVQRVGQGDSEGVEDMPPQPVYILEWQP